jgi:uncharacterized membrane protein
MSLQQGAPRRRHRGGRVVAVVVFVLLTAFVVLLGIGTLTAPSANTGTLVGVFAFSVVADILLFVLAIHRPREHQRRAGSTGADESARQPVTGGRWSRIRFRFPRTVLALLWVLFVLTVAGLVAMIVVTLLDEFYPGGQGTPGTAVITHCQGQGTNMQCYGDFRSHDGTISLTDTRIYDRDFANIGQTATVYYDAGSRSVDALASGQKLSFNLIWVGWLSVLAFVQFFLRIVSPLHRRKSQQAQAAIAELRRRNAE